MTLYYMFAMQTYNIMSLQQTVWAVDVIMALLYTYIMPIFLDSPEQNVYCRVGERIRRARMDAGLTQAALANAVSLSRTSITNIERGRQPILLHTLYSIASVLKTKVADFLPENEISSEAKVKPRIPDYLDQHEQAWIETLVTEGDPQS